MKLDYGTQLSSFPIKLSIGTLRKPTLNEIGKITFDKFIFYEFLIKMTPELYYTKLLKNNESMEYWLSLSEERKQRITLFELIQKEEILRNLYLEVLNFFFLETVVYQDNHFLLLKGIYVDEKQKNQEIQGIISQENMQEILELLQQICCIYSENENINNMKFKNNLAKKIMNKILKAKKKDNDKIDINLTIPNIISAVCNRHPSLNYTNIGELTIFQLFDSFYRLRTNIIFDINSTSVSVWGDEKKAFDYSFWYMNNYDNK